MKPILENWKHIKEAEALAQERTGDPKASFTRDQFFFDGVRKLTIPIRFKKKKANGQETQKYYEILVVAKYCPFTGLPLYEDEEE